MHLAFSSAGKASLDYVDITKLRDIIDERAYSSLIGIVTAIIGNVLISLALNTQRYAHIKLEQRRLHELEKQNFSSDDSSDDVCQAHAGPADRDHTSGNAKGNDELRPLLPHDQSDHDVAAETDGEDENYNAHYLQSPWWWLGITLMTVGECGNFLAYGFAPASVVSPLGVVALVANCLIAPWMLREHFRVRDGLGVIIAIAGCVVVVLSAAGESDAQLDAAQIWALIATWEFELYLGITLTLIVILVLLSTRYGTKYILVPLGLVGLFGKSVIICFEVMLRHGNRWLYGTRHQGCGIFALAIVLEDHYIPSDISLGRRAHRYGCASDQIYQSRFTSI